MQKAAHPFEVAFRVSHPDGGHLPQDLPNALVDTGATYSEVSELTLGLVGVAPDGEVEITLADGSQIKRPLGVACIECAGHKVVYGVVFAPFGRPATLGIDTLTKMGLVVDPLGRRLLDFRRLRFALKPFVRVEAPPLTYAGRDAPCQ